MFKDIQPLNEKNKLPWENDKLIFSHQNLPTLSIVIPNYNGGEFLEKTLRSLLCNNLNGVEIIMQDANSTDNSHAIIHRYKEVFSKIYAETDKGQSDAINRGFQKSTGDILYWLNSDDILLPNTLNTVREYFLNNPHCNILVGNAFMTEKDFTPIRHFKFEPTKLNFNYLIDYAQNHLIQPSVFFNRIAWEKAGPLNIDDHYAMDADLFIGMSKLFEIHHIDLDIAYSVYHEKCKTRGSRAESIVSLALVQAKYGGLKEAKKTLDILISLYNDAVKESNNRDVNSQNCELTNNILHSKLISLENMIKSKQDLLIHKDLENNS